MSNDIKTAVRSPSYPVMSLSDAVSAVRKIEAQYRSAKVDREIAAKVIGYSGLSGPANKSLAALAQYGLVERAGKGEMRVTARARAILHPDSDSEKQRELHAAAFEPSLFRELQERYGTMMPPEDGVVMFLNRKGFNQTAIRPAAKAYLHTLLFLEAENAIESHGGDDHKGPDDGATQEEDAPVQSDTGGMLEPMALKATATVGASPLNAINMNIRAGQVHLEALLDAKGLVALEQKIKALKVLLGDDGESSSSESAANEDDDGRAG